MQCKPETMQMHCLCHSRVKLKLPYSTTHRAWGVNDFHSSGGWWLFDLKPTGVNPCVLQDHCEGIRTTLTEHSKVHLFWLQQESPHCSHSTGRGGVYLATDWFLYHCKLFIKQYHNNMKSLYITMLYTFPLSNQCFCMYSQYLWWQKFTHCMQIDRFLILLSGYLDYLKLV